MNFYTSDQNIKRQGLLTEAWNAWAHALKNQELCGICEQKGESEIEVLWSNPKSSSVHKICYDKIQPAEEVLNEVIKNCFNQAFSFDPAISCEHTLYRSYSHLLAVGVIRKHCGMSISESLEKYGLQKLTQIFNGVGVESVKQVGKNYTKIAPFLEDVDKLVNELYDQIIVSDNNNLSSSYPPGTKTKAQISKVYLNGLSASLGTGAEGFIPIDEEGLICTQLGFRRPNYFQTNDSIWCMVIDNDFHGKILLKVLGRI